MIASVTGRVLERRADALVIQVGGVGLLVLCAPATCSNAKLGDEVTLATTLVVREDSLTLFGFESAESRALFETIQAVNGFGPKLTFTLLAHLTPDDLREAIATEDIARLTRTPGVGTKGAARLVLELKGKLGRPTGTGATAPEWRESVASALVGLGWSATQASRVTDSLATSAPADADVADMLRQALRELGQQ